MLLVLMVATASTIKISTYQNNALDYINPMVQCLIECPCGNKGVAHLVDHFIRHLLEWFDGRQLVGGTLEKTRREGSVGVENLEHFLVKILEEIFHSSCEVNGAAGVVLFEFFEHFCEHLRVLSVNDAVGFGEHVVQAQLGGGEDIFEVFVELDFARYELLSQVK